MLTKNSRHFFRVLFQFRTKSPIIYWVLIFLFVADFSALYVLPHLISDSFYFYRFLNEKAINSTEDFFRQKKASIPDRVLGWKNKPNTSRGNWVIDEHGSRATRKFGYTTTSSCRVLFLGSSMINGGSHVTNNETISAYTEDEQIETINFASMMYSLDQSYLAYIKRYAEYNPKIVVVGLDNDPISGLRNQYLPFRYPEEVNMPFVKPRYKLVEGKLILIPPPLDLLKEVKYKSERLLSYLREQDEFYPKFQWYKQTGFTPLASLLSMVLNKYNNMRSYFDGSKVSDELMMKLMTEFEILTKKNGVRLLFISLADQTTFERGGIRAYFPDVYQNRIDLFRAHEFEIIDSRALFRMSGISSGDLYLEDRIHFRSTGNRVVANGIKERLPECYRNSSVEGMQ